MRSESTDSNMSDSPTSPTRRFSISEMFFGAKKPQKLQTQTSVTSEGTATMDDGRRISITENRDFRDFVSRQKHLVDDQ